MKKIITLLLILVIFEQSSFAQYFQGGLTNTGNKLSFKMKPTGNITTQISYIEVAFRYNVANTPAFTVGNITNNVTNFTGTLNIQRLGDYIDINDPTYNYIKFVHNTGVIASKTYMAGIEYEIFTVTLDGSPATGNIELASDLTDGNYIFGVADGSGLQIDPGAGDQLYGTGFFKVGNGQFVPLNNVPLPVKFLGFDVVRKNNSAVLSWSVENESALTDKYIIEKSANSIDFLPVTTIAAANNGKESNSYSFIQDDLAAIRNSGVLYFRIKQVDKDGKFVYTPIKNVRLDGKAFAVNAYPNPVKSYTKLTIDLVDESKILISITDASGKQVKSMQVQGFKGPNIKDVNLSNLSNGNYMMKVQAGNEVKSIPLVKVN
jgi:signal peptidase I